MGKNIQGERITGDISIVGSMTASSYYGDGSNLTGISGGGVSSDWNNSTRTVPYRLDGNATKVYKFTHMTNGATTITGNIGGEKIFAQSFYAKPGEKINEICFRIMTAGAAGLGLAAVRILIYRTKLDANGALTGGDLELDTNIDVSTLSAGFKVVTGLNHTLSSNTYGNKWYMCIRNYQSGSLSIKMVNGIITQYGDLSLATSTLNRDLCWSWVCLWNSPTPASMPMVSSGAQSTTAVSENTTGLPVIGYSNY
jgi:hypothetical protein